MGHILRRLLYWTPRVLGILYELFFSVVLVIVTILSLTQCAGLWRADLIIPITVAAIALPAIALAVAWRREWLGAVIYIGLGLASQVLTMVTSTTAPTDFSTPLFVLGGLFLVAWFGGRPSAASQ